MSPSRSAADHVILVDLVVEEGARDRFMPLMQANAAASLAQETGCLRFDICVDPQDPAKILLYEIYEDEAAFDLHLASAHYRAFDQATRSMIASKTVRRLVLKAG